MRIPKADPDAVERTASLLARGGTAVLPCDTIYGLVGTAPDTLDRLRAIKGRGEDKPFLMLIADPAWMKPWTDMPLPPALAPFWPGELTLLFRGRESPDKAAFRLPRDPFLLAILNQVGRPLYSTSVNRTGGPHLWRIEDIVSEFGKEVDMIIDAGDLPAGVPSTILDLTVRPYAVVRQGKVVIPPSVSDGSK